MTVRRDDGLGFEYRFVGMSMEPCPRIGRLMPIGPCSSKQFSFGHDTFNVQPIFICLDFDRPDLWWNLTVTRQCAKITTANVFTSRCFVIG